MRVPSKLFSVERLRELAREQSILAKSKRLTQYERGLAEGMRIAYYDAASRLEWETERQKGVIE